MKSEVKEIIFGKENVTSGRLTYSSNTKGSYGVEWGWSMLVH